MTETEKRMHRVCFTGHRPKNLTHHEKGWDVRLLCACPFNSFESGWSKDWQRQYKEILATRGEYMNVEIIYEKKYPRINPIEEMKQIEWGMADEPEEATSTFEEFMQKMQAKTTYVLMPGRIKASEKFIQTAIELSELYELDTRIERHFDHISVTYSFDCCGGLRYINRVFGMADQFSFFKDIYGWDITISLDFFTHASIRNGRIVSP